MVYCICKENDNREELFGMADGEQARLAREIYERLGGEKNIMRAANCMTRLRVQLAKKDEALVASVKGVKGVLGVVDAGD